jgi:hypothetical protein
MGINLSDSGCHDKHVSCEGKIQPPTLKASSTAPAIDAYKVFGELEYIFGCIKITFISMLIVLMLIIDVMKREF